MENQQKNSEESVLLSSPGEDMQVSDIEHLNPEHRPDAGDQDPQAPLTELSRDVAAAIVSNAFKRAPPEASLTLNPHPIAPPPHKVSSPVWPVVDLTGEPSTSSGGIRPGEDVAEDFPHSKAIKEAPLTSVKIEGGNNYSPHPPRSANQQPKSPSPLLQLTPQSDPFWHSSKENWDPNSDLQQYGEEPRVLSQPAKPDQFEPKLNHQGPSARLLRAMQPDANADRADEELPNWFMNPLPHPPPPSQRSTTESELMKLAEELRRSRQEQDLRSREQELQSREQRQTIAQLMAVVQGLQEDRKSSEQGGTAQSKGTIAPDLRVKSESDTSKVALNTLKVPHFQPLDGLFRSRDYCRTMLDFQLQNSHLNPVQAVGFIVATFKNNSSAFTYWSRWRAALLELTVPEAHAAILSVSAGHTMADQVSLYATQPVNKPGPATDTPTMTTAAKVSALMGQDAISIDDIRDPLGRRFPPIPAWVILIERTIGSRAVAGEISVVLGLKMGVSNTMHKDVSSSETPSQFAIRCCETRECFDTTQTVCDVNLPSLLQLYINGLPASLKEVYQQQRITLNVGNKSVEERLAAVALVINNAWSNMHADKISHVESDLRKSGAREYRSQAPHQGGHAHVHTPAQASPQHSSKASEGRFKPRNFQTFATISSNEGAQGEKNQGVESVALTSITKPELPMPPTGPSSEPAGKFTSSNHYGIKPRNGGRPSPLVGGRGGRNESQYQGGGGRGYSAQPHHDRRDSEPQRFRSLDKTTDPRLQDRSQQDHIQQRSQNLHCYFCSREGHRESECDLKKQAITNLKVGMQNRHNSFPPSQKRVGWDPNLPPQPSNLRHQGGSSQRHQQQQVAATTVTHNGSKQNDVDNEDLYWRSNSTSHMALVHAHTVDDAIEPSQETVSEIRTSLLNKELIYLPLFERLGQWELQTLQDPDFFITLPMIKTLVESIKIQAVHFDLQLAIDKDMFYETIGDQGGIRDYARTFKELMSQIDEHIGMLPSDYTTRLRQTDLFFKWIRSACQNILEIARLRMHELITLGDILEWGDEQDLSSATTGFWLDRPDWQLSWEYLSSRSTLRDIFTRRGLLYTLALVKEVWEPALPQTSSGDEHDPNKYTLDQEGETREPSIIDEASPDDDPPQDQSVSCMTFLEQHSDSHSSDDADYDDEEQLAPAISHWVGPHNSWEVSTPLGSGFFRATIQGLKTCVLEFGLEDRLGKDINRLEQLATRAQPEPSQLGSRKDSSRMIIYPHQWEFEHKVALTYIWASIRTAAELHCKELADGRVSEYMEKRGDSIFFSHGCVPGTPLEKLMRRYPWRPNPRYQRHLGMDPKELINEYIKNLAPMDEVSTMDVTGVIECLFTSTHLIRKRTQKRTLQCLLAALMTEAESLATSKCLHDQDSHAISLKLIIQAETRNIYFWIEGNTAKGGSQLVEPWHWPAIAAAWLASAHKAYRELHHIHQTAMFINVGLTDGTEAQHISPSPQTLSPLIKTPPKASTSQMVSMLGISEKESTKDYQSRGLGFDLSSHIISMENERVCIFDVEQVICWLWDVYHILEVDTLLLDSYFKRVLSRVVTADTGRDWAAKPGLFKTLIRTITSEIIDKEEQVLCCKLVGLDADESMQNFDMAKWSGYEVIREALQLLELAAESRLTQLVGDDKAPYWIKRSGYKQLKDNFLQLLDKEQAPPGFISPWIVHTTGKSELDLIMPFLITSNLSSAKQEVMESFSKEDDVNSIAEYLMEDEDDETESIREVRLWQHEHRQWRSSNFHQPPKPMVSHWPLETESITMETLSAGGVMSVRRSRIMNWEDYASISFSKNINHLVALATVDSYANYQDLDQDDDESAPSTHTSGPLSQVQINQALLIKFRNNHPHFFTHPAYQYIQGKKVCLDSRTKEGKDMGIRYLPYFQDLVPDFQKYFNIFRTPVNHPQGLVWGANAILAWDLIIKLFKEALAGADCLVIVDKFSDVKFGPWKGSRRPRIPYHVTPIKQWREEHWPFSSLLENGNLKKPQTADELELMLSKLKQHETVLGYCGSPHLATRFHTLVNPLQQLLYQAKKRHWEPEQITAYIYITSQIHEVLQADDIIKARMAASLHDPTSLCSPPTPPHDQHATSLLSFTSHGMEMDTDDENWGYHSDEGSVDFGYLHHGVSLMSFAHPPKFRNMKEAKRFPESYAPDNEFSGLALPKKGHGHRPPSAPRPLSFTPQPSSVPPSEEEYMEQKALRARLRYLVQPSQDLTQCLGLVVNGQVHVNFRVLLDDASNANLMTRVLADRLGIPILCSEQKLTTMTEKGMSVSGETPLLELVYAPTSSQPFSVFHKFVVIDPKNDLNGIYDVLIGNSDSQAYRSTIDGVNEVFTIRPDFALYGVQSREISLPTEWQRPFKARRSASMRS
jgi:hypothetical protein